MNEPWETDDFRYVVTDGWDEVVRPGLNVNLALEGKPDLDISDDAWMRAKHICDTTASMDSKVAVALVIDHLQRRPRSIRL